MTESRIGFLYNIASCLPLSDNNEKMQLLCSYYLMRCKEITGGLGLPTKQFSSAARCPRCCLEWNKNTVVKIQPISLSKRQKQSTRSNKKTNVIRSNQMTQTCSFCNHTTITILPKPVKEYPKPVKQENCIKIVSNEKKVQKAEKELPNKNKSKQKVQKAEKELANKNKTKPTTKSVNDALKTNNSNIYSNAFDVFSLKNKQNVLASAVKETPKLIKNNKKKKDKFAGLFEKAVLASAKINRDKLNDKKQDRLSLFLKPSSG